MISIEILIRLAKKLGHPEAIIFKHTRASIEFFVKNILVQEEQDSPAILYKLSTDEEGRHHPFSLTTYVWDPVAMEYRTSDREQRQRAASAPAVTSTPAYLNKLFQAAQQSSCSKSTTRRRRAKTACTGMIIKD